MDNKAESGKRPDPFAAQKDELLFKGSGKRAAEARQQGIADLRREAAEAGSRGDFGKARKIIARLTELEKPKP